MNYLFTKKGTGDPVILLHGWGGSTESLEALQSALSENYNVFNLELPGHGELKEIDAVYDFDKFIQYLHDFLKGHDLKKVTLLGHSFGGNLAMRYAAMYPNQINKLVLINSSGLKPKNTLKKIFWKSISIVFKPITKLPGGKIFRELIYKGIIREHDYIQTSGYLKETFSQITKDHISRKLLKKISCDTFLIWGRYDTYTPLWMGLDLKKLIRNSELLILDAKHNLPLKSPELISDKIINFIKRQ